MFDKYIKYNCSTLYNNLIIECEGNNNLRYVLKCM